MISFKGRIYGLEVTVVNQSSAAPRWRTNDNFLLRTIAGESVLIPIGEVPDPRFDNCMISVNETTAFLWEFFSEEARTEQQAVEAAEAAFSAPEGVIAQHIHEFVIAYAEYGLLIEED